VPHIILPPASPRSNAAGACVGGGRMCGTFRLDHSYGRWRAGCWRVIEEPCGDRCHSRTIRRNSPEGPYRTLSLHRRRPGLAGCAKQGRACRRKDSMQHIPSSLDFGIGQQRLISGLKTHPPRAPAEDGRCRILSFHLQAPAATLRGLALVEGECVVPSVRTTKFGPGTTSREGAGRGLALLLRWLLNPRRNRGCPG
jgi:hypothetical protein